MLGRNVRDLVDFMTDLGNGASYKNLPSGQDVERMKLPRHVAIIMDGNGRWAQEQGLPRREGHRAGVEAVKRAVKGCAKFGIKYLTVYAFSTENWKRPSGEVKELMRLVWEGFQRELSELEKENVRVRIIGLRERLPARVVKAVEESVNRTATNTGLQLQIALNYGSRAEIVSACRRVVQAVQSGELRLEDLDENVFASFLFTHDIPDPDLIIRTGGECRLSNFLLWQAAYAEIWTTEVKWPEFDEETLLEALRYYACKERRFGGLGSSPL